MAWRVDDILFPCAGIILVLATSPPDSFMSLELDDERNSEMQLASKIVFSLKGFHLFVHYAKVFDWLHTGMWC